MSGLLDRAAELFLAPAGPAPATARVTGVPPESTAVAVLGAAEDAAPIARLLATELRLRTRSACTLMGEWRPEPDAGPDDVAAPGTVAGLGTASARRLAARLSGRGLTPQPHGRLVRLGLARDPGTAALQWERALAAAGCPAVLAVAGPRPDRFDDLLDDHDLLVLVAPDGAAPELVDLAVASLGTRRPPVVTCRPVPPAAARLVASSSIATSHLLGPELIAAVRGLA